MLHNSAYLFLGLLVTEAALRDRPRGITAGVGVLTGWLERAQRVALADRGKPAPLTLPRQASTPADRSGAAARGRPGPGGRSCRCASNRHHRDPRHVAPLATSTDRPEVDLARTPGRGCCWRFGGSSGAWRRRIRPRGLHEDPRYAEERRPPRRTLDPSADPAAAADGATPCRPSRT